jgi:hypothetical protein
LILVIVNIDTSHWAQGTVSLNHLGGKTGILYTEKRAPKPLVKRPPPCFSCVSSLYDFYMMKKQLIVISTSMKSQFISISCIVITDLRQDMLTLQIIGIMDSIWQSDGLDLR